MTIDLKPELEALIKKHVQRSYQSVGEYVEKAILMLHEEEERLHRKKEVIDQQIANGLRRYRELTRVYSREVDHL